MANKRISATVTIGGALTSGLLSALDTAKSKIAQVGAAVQKLEREQGALNKQIHAYAGYGKGLEQLVSKHAAVTRELEKQRQIMSANKLMQSGKDRMGAAGMALGTVGAIASVGILPVVEAANFEKAMLGVAKQVDGARDASGKLTPVYFDMAKRIQMLGREVPIATEQLAEMAAAGARMGIAKDELIEFTKTSAMMADAFELPAGELAEQMGKIKTLFGMKTQKEVVALADSINYLDDNAISKGGDIIEFLQRTGGLASNVKIGGKELAALGSTLLTLGERTESAGTAVNAIAMKFAAADSGTKKFKAAMKEIGLSTRDVQLGMQTDAQGTILKVMDAVNKLPVDQRLGVMVQLVGLEHADTMAKLAGGVGEYRKQIGLANSQKAEGSMSREFQSRLATTTAQWEIMKNRASELGVTIGAMLLPPLNKMFESIGPIITEIGELLVFNKDMIGNLAALAGGLVAGYAAFQLFSAGVGAVQFAFGALRMVIAGHPVLLAATLLGTAAILIYKNWEPISDFFKGMWISITESFQDGIKWIMDKIQWVGTKWKEFKSFIGVDGPRVSVGTNQPTLDGELPKFQGAVAAGTVNNNQQNTFNIQQKPGQSSEQLAEDLARVLEKMEAKKRRGQLIDGAGVQ